MNGTMKTQDKPYVRRAHHAGSWYTDNTNALHSVLEDFLLQAQPMEPTPAIAQSNTTNDVYDIPKSIIAPHAGFSYSGPTAAYAYWGLREALEKRSSGSPGAGVRTVLVLHPSHHVYLDGCAISGASLLETPVGNLPVDDELRKELMDTGYFTIMSKEDDEKEHSGEMQYPFIAKVYHDAIRSQKKNSSSSNSLRNAPLLQALPIMVGGLSQRKEEHFGQILAPILARPDIFCVVSSDFCHWGERFGYTPTPSPTDSPQTIHSYIHILDRIGMDHIAMQEPGAFAKYLKKFKNTICGRHPISVWMHGIKQNKEKGLESVNIAFVKYAQSSAVKHTWESSVSYASAIARVEKQTANP